MPTRKRKSSGHQPCAKASAQPSLLASPRPAHEVAECLAENRARFAAGMADVAETTARELNKKMNSELACGVEPNEDGEWRVVVVVDELPLMHREDIADLIYEQLLPVYKRAGYGAEVYTSPNSRMISLGVWFKLRE
jgi:hypothetical protein